jgi:hypothetical protein
MARRPTGRGRAPKKSSNPLPMVIGGIVVLAVVIGFFMMGGDEETNTDGGDAPAAEESSAAGNSTTTAAPKRTGKLYDGKTKAEWKALKAKVDMSAWDNADRLMGEARKKLAAAERLRGAGDEAGFKREIQPALKAYEKATNAIQDFIFVVNSVHDELWYTDAKMFGSEDKAITKFNKQFRGYLQFRK